ncbi:hypothetical protein D3C84_684680 [compost metagenome]
MVCSQRYWRSLSALLTFTASRPERVSIRLDWRSAASAMVRSMVATSGFCNSQLMPMARGKASSGTQTRWPPSRPITRRINRVKGRSMTLVRVSEARKSRSVWNSWMFWAKLPTRIGRCFIAMPTIRSNRVAEMIRSVFLPARSRHRPRMVLSSRSKR